MKRPTLMYHDVVEPGQPDASGFPGGAAAHYKLDASEFAAHLDALQRSGLHFGVLTDPADAGQRTGLLTFDDGGASAVAIATMLEARGMRGHFLITTGRIGEPGFVSADQLRALHAAGHVVGSHSHTHPAEISRLDTNALADEWNRSVDCLSGILGAPVTVASVPGGFHSRAVAQAAAAAGIRHMFTSEPTLGHHMVDGCQVLGRYTLWRGMPASRAVALAVGWHGARPRQWLAWNLKKPLKRWARPAYRLLRRHWLEESPSA